MTGLCGLYVNVPVMVSLVYGAVRAVGKWTVNLHSVRSLRQYDGGAATVAATSEMDEASRTSTTEENRANMAGEVVVVAVVGDRSTEKRKEEKARQRARC